MILYIVLVLVGFYALYGLIQLNGSTITDGLYFVVAILALGFVGFSLMRVRRSFALANPAPNKVFEIVKCKQCSFKQIKNFAIGDYVTKTLGLCTQCNTANLFIDGIYGEGPQRK
jgi:hypothetical protein